MGEPTDEKGKRSGRRPGDWSTRKKTPGPRASTHPATPGTADMSNWRTKLRESRLKFNDAAKAVFLHHLAETGLVTHSAKEAGVTRATVLNHREIDPEFNDAFIQAESEFNDKFLLHARTLMIQGSDEPIVGGKDKDEIITYKTVFPTNLIALEMKRVDPTYREGGVAAISAGGGVLLVPATATEEEWEAMIEDHNSKVVQPDPPEDLK